MTTQELIEKYPFLKIQHQDGSVSQSHTFLDYMPSGWHKAFADMFCDEVLVAAKADGCLDDLMTGEVKEKFGEMRWYFYGESESVRTINRKYCALSSGICIACGKPDVRTTDGWITPICYECWKKTRHSNNSEEDYKKVTADGIMPNVIRWRSWNSAREEWDDFRVDISNTANKIRARWRAGDESKI